MNSLIIKTILILLISFLPFSFVHAQQLEEVKPITKEYQDSTWYKTQATLWQKELLKNKKNEAAWMNYFLANRYYFTYQQLRWETYDLQMKKILNEMEKSIPRSYVFNLSTGWHMGTWDKASIPYLLEAQRLQPQSPRVLNELIVRYEVFGPQEKKKELCKQYYQSNDLSPGLINFNYNVLASLEKNAILSPRCIYYDEEQMVLFLKPDFKN